MNCLIKLQEDSKLPVRRSDDAEGYDIFANSSPKIVGNCVDKKFDARCNLYSSVSYIEYETGVYIAPESEYFVHLMPRSSISKYNLILCNSIGLIDTDYRGQLIVRFKYIIQPENLVIHADRRVYTKVDLNMIYKSGDAIAQLEFCKSYRDVEFEIVEELPKTNRGEGAFGSTGV